MSDSPLEQTTPASQPSGFVFDLSNFTLEDLIRWNDATKTTDRVAIMQSAMKSNPLGVTDMTNSDEQKKIPLALYAQLQREFREHIDAIFLTA
jgi:hypothetical protein